MGSRIKKYFKAYWDDKGLFPVDKGNQILKPSKAYLDNTTLLGAVNTFLSSPIEIDTVRELAFMQFVSGAGLQTFFPKIGDFQINDIVFEVGGKNKTWEQLKSYSGKKILVKDNLLVGNLNEIPLYLFGFLY